MFTVVAVAASFVMTSFEMTAEVAAGGVVELRHRGTCCCGRSCPEDLERGTGHATTLAQL